MSNPVTGIRQQLAIKKAPAATPPAWSTAIQCGAGDQVLFLQGQAGRDATVAIDNSRGKGFSTDGVPGPIKCAGTFDFNMRYDGMDVLLACFMGLSGVPSVVSAPAYGNTHRFAPDIYGYYVTVAKSMGEPGGLAYIEEIPTAKIVGVTISGQAGSEPLKLTIEYIGDRKNWNTTAGGNTTTTFASVTLPTGADKNPVLFQHLAFMINDQATDTNPATQLYPSKFTLTLKRNLQGEYTGQYRTAGTNSQDLIDEPVNINQPDMKLALEFPIHTDTTWLTVLGNDTRKKMVITATSPGKIVTTYPWFHEIRLPHLQMSTDKVSDVEGRITEPLEFLIHGLTTNSFTSGGASKFYDATNVFLEPIRWLVQNQRTTNPLA